jgi:hypothetical protein
MITRILSGSALITAVILVAAACGGASSGANAESPPARAAPAAAQAAQSPGMRATTPTAAERAAAREEAARRRAEETRQRDAELAARGVRRLAWEELMPEGESERLAQMYQAQMMMLYSAAGGGIAEGSSADQAIQIGTFNTVRELDGKKIRLPGYTVPFDFSTNAEIREFLLVPYFGACLHAPPPPPNQTVFVITETPIKVRDLAQAVWIEGTIHTQRQDTELAGAAYTIRMTGIEAYTY